MPPSTRESLPRRAGELATRATGRMEAEHQWFRELGAADRSWVGLVAQAGISALLDWYADGARTDPPGQVFAAAPPSLAGTITLAQTLDLARTAVPLAPLSQAGSKIGMDSPAADDPVYREAFARAWASADLVEGQTAFTERRSPVFEGR